MFISPAYGGRCSDKVITANSVFLDCLRPGDEVMADRGFVIQDLLYERKVKLTLPEFTKKGNCQKRTPQTLGALLMYVSMLNGVLHRLKNFINISQTVPITLAPKFDKVLRVCADT